MNRWIVVLSDGTFEELDAGQIVVEVTEDYFTELMLSANDFPFVPDCEDLESKHDGILTHIHVKELVYNTEWRDN